MNIFMSQKLLADELDKVLETVDRAVITNAELNETQKDIENNKEWPVQPLRMDI